MTPLELRALFPTAEKCLHLNHAGTSPTAAPAAEAVNVVLRELMSDDILQGYLNHIKRQKALRTLLGRMLNVAPSTLAFTRNTSQGLTLAAQGIPFREGENVVAPRVEYPSNIYPWQAQAYRGVSVTLVPPRPDFTVDEEALLAACDDRTRVLAVSWVQWGTGQRLDLARLGRFCRERGIVFVVDIVQGAGALTLDLGSLPIDIAAAGCHKWLLSPGGMGFLYIRPEVFRTFLPINIGWNSVTNPMAWDAPHFEDIKSEPDRMEEGTPNLLGTAALLTTLELLESVGFDTVNDRVLSLAGYAKARLRDRGMMVRTPAGPAGETGIVAFTHPDRSHAEVLEALAQAKVIAVERQNFLRFSPHVYNTEDEIDRAVGALP
ncbi:MAG: aminotransferase class V-fold PLP-dependent enzyme [Capsulimonadales bacterium]|nr:aminotransferase class V-fold PLP-dependent enzyme [Capsulimonadales bacterium]